MKKSLPRKIASKLIRLPFGGSDRRHHLRMAAVASVAASVSSFQICQEYLELGIAPSAGLALTAWAGSYAQEAWASADRDEEEKRRPANVHWLDYGRRIKHRSWASHGLVVGTAIRLAYGYACVPYFMVWFGIPDVLGHPVSLIGMAWIYGALVNDLGHLILDV